MQTSCAIVAPWADRCVAFALSHGYIFPRNLCVSRDCTAVYSWIPSESRGSWKQGEYQELGHSFVYPGEAAIYLRQNHSPEYHDTGVCHTCEGDMMERSRNYADPAQTTYITAGALRFGIEYRRLQNDQGICIHVFAGPDDRQDEVLRFDCFEREPHYHYAWSKIDR